MGGKHSVRDMFSAKAAIISLGVAGITAQALLLRELLVQFHGNEFSVGTIIGNWVAAEALGVYLAGRSSLRSHPVKAFITLTAVFSLLLPLHIVLIRIFKPFVAIQVGMGLTLGQMFLASLLLLLLPAALHGFQFIVATKLYALLPGEGETAPGRAYALDSAGTMIGGVLAACVIVPLFTAVQICGLLLVFGGVASMALWRAQPREAGRSSLAASLLLLAAALLLFAGGAGMVEKASLARQWGGREVLANRNSPYQNITVIRDGEQLTFYTDGMPFTSLPHPDSAALEELAHLPALAHPRPKKVLLLGGGAGGLPAEFLKYGTVSRIDCLELDPALLATVLGFAAPGLREIRHDDRVRFHYLDGRRFLLEGKDRYDLILVNTPLPLTLHANRYFSREFFRQLRSRLEPDGIAAFVAPGSTAYYSPELKDITATLMTTVREVFPHLLVIPGETNVFLASAEAEVESLDAALLAGRLEERQVSTALITPEHLSWRLDHSQALWFQENIGVWGGETNRDFSPKLLSANLSQSTALFNPWLKPLLAGVKGVGGVAMATAVAVMVLGYCGLGFCRPKVAMPALVAASGMAGMLLELILIFIFQIFSGVMFQSIALLIAAYMGGLCTGSLVSSGKGISDYRRLMAGELGLLLLTATVLLFVGYGMSLPPITPLVAYAAILPLLFASGFFAGLQFPAAVRLQQGSAVAASASVGAVYTAELLGGCLGGWFGGVLLLPFLGLGKTCTLILFLKLGSLLLLQIQRKRCKIIYHD